MGESRLSALALMYIKYDMPVNLDEIVNLFEGLHPRMMQFTSLVYDYQQIDSYQNLTGRGMYIELSCLSGNNYALEMMYIV